MQGASQGVQHPLIVVHDEDLLLHGCLLWCHQCYHYKSRSRLRWNISTSHAMEGGATFRALRVRRWAPIRHASKVRYICCIPSPKSRRPCEAAAFSGRSVKRSRPSGECDKGYLRNGMQRPRSSETPSAAPFSPRALIRTLGEPSHGLTRRSVASRSSAFGGLQERFADRTATSCRPMPASS